MIIINDEMVKKLFTTSDPLDKMVEVSGIPFKVIGVYHYQGSFLSGGNRPRAIIPIEIRGSELALSIGDRGSGFPKDMIRRAFEPYVTTKAKGTGLGLAIVKKIVEEHHGRVTVENRPQNGALVTLYFPLEGNTN